MLNMTKKDFGWRSGGLDSQMTSTAGSLRKLYGRELQSLALFHKEEDLKEQMAYYSDSLTVEAVVN
jgi:hypothetical protein